METAPAEPPFAVVPVGSHTLALLKDGAQAFPAMLSAIALARSTVCLESYIVRADKTGNRFFAALKERARAGVEVSLLYDAWGSSIAAEVIADVELAGVRTLAFHPLRFSGKRRAVLGRLARRNHKKSLIVDSGVAFMGGINISDDYAPLADGGGGWRDTHLRIEGPAALELEYFYLRTWKRGGGDDLTHHRYGSEARRPDPRVVIVTSDARRGRSSIRHAYHEAISKAKQRIWITNAYFLPSLRLLGALADAARRGVDVRIMVAGATDVPAVLYASRSIYEVLLNAGARLFEYTGRILHAKTAVVDGCWSTVGSSNLDAQSLRMNLEANAIVRSDRFARALEAMFEEDLRGAEEITKEHWERRSVLSKAVSWGAYLFRDWL